MRTTLRRSMTGLLLLTALTTTMQVRADILDDILGITTAARDRATEARNNAASARDRATEARNNAAAARDTAITARDTAIEMRDTMREGLELLTDGMQSAIGEAIEDIEREIADEIEGRDAYLQSGAAEPFREDLISLLQNSQVFLTTLNGIAGLPNAQVDFAGQISVIEALPTRALYPLYRGMAVETRMVGPGGFNELLARATTDLQVIAAVLLDSPDPIEGELLDQELHLCSHVINNLTEIRRATGDLTKFSLGARTLGTLLKAKGTTIVQKKVSLWGWAGTVVTNSWVKKIGTVLDGMGNAVSGLTSYVSTKTRYCAAIGIEEEARERDEEILRTQRLLLRLLGQTEVPAPRP